jgi:hypothetical protein
MEDTLWPRLYPSLRGYLACQAWPANDCLSLPVVTDENAEDETGFRGGPGESRG